MIAKNENLIARRLNSNGCIGDVLAVTPDLITIIDSDTGMTKNIHKLHCTSTCNRIISQRFVLIYCYIVCVKCKYVVPTGAYYFCTT